MSESGNGFDWREEYAYTLGVQAFVFGFPWMYLSMLRYLWTNVAKDPARTPYAPLNQFWHLRQLADASYRDGGSPNNDTPYSIAWLDVGKEPVVLSHPDMGDRYFTFEIAGLDSDNFAYVGKRTTGSAAGAFAIVGPNWQGDLPEGVTALSPSRTSAVLIFGRTLVDGADDMEEVKRLQDEYRLTPLSLWGADTLGPEDRDVWPPFPTDDDPLAAWKTMNRAMSENPPGRHEDILASLATIGLGPEQDVEAQDDATKRGLARAAKAGRDLLGGAMRGLGPMRNGWNYPPSTMGRAGDHADFLTRGAVQCLGGIIANDPEEAMYPNAFVDTDGVPLTGTSKYRIRFEPGELPPVHEFWSLTLYGTDANFVDNPINRYAIGNRTPDLEMDSDGALTIRLQSDEPDGGNWLPTPKSDQFYLVIRLYSPDERAVSGAWSPPAIERVG